MIDHERHEKHEKLIKKFPNNKIAKKSYNWGTSLINEKFSR
jgi:hypothetical protein